MMKLVELRIPEIDVDLYLHIEENCLLSELKDILRCHLSINEKDLLFYHATSGRFIPENIRVEEGGIESGDDLTCFLI